MSVSVRVMPHPVKIPGMGRAVPMCLRNPLYHWTHLELNKPFGINDRLLNGDNAEEVWQHCNGLLQSDAFTTQGLMNQWQVEVVCTTDDPADTLEHHRTCCKLGSSCSHAPLGVGRRDGLRKCDQLQCLS